MMMRTTMHFSFVVAEMEQDTINRPDTPSGRAGRASAGSNRGLFTLNANTRHLEFSPARACERLVHNCHGNWWLHLIDIRLKLSVSAKVSIKS